MYTLIIQYRTKNSFVHPFQSQQLTLDETISLIEDLELTRRIKSYEVTDEHDSSWTLKELKKFQQELSEEPHHIQIYFDGNYNQITYEAGVGFVIYYEQNGERYRIRKNRYMTHMTSNNEVEYAALYAAVEELSWLGVRSQTISIYGDSQVVIKQMSGDWPVYEQKLESWADKIDALLRKRKLDADYTHINRSENKEANQLATQALSKINIEATTKIE